MTEDERKLRVEHVAHALEWRAQEYEATMPHTARELRADAAAIRALLAELDAATAREGTVLPRSSTLENRADGSRQAAHLGRQEHA